MSTLLLRLAAPLQAWGTDSKFETRRTGREPSKSGVVGLLAAALGIRRDGDLSRLNGLSFGVRVDQEGTMLRDYHTAHSTKSNGDKISYITNRYYLADAVFLVGLESEDEAFLQDLEEALQHPAFPLFLGRRSCPPAQPLVVGIRPLGLEEALRAEAWQISDWMRKKWLPRQEQPRLRLVLDCRPNEAGAVYLHDLPITFHPERRRYGIRTARQTNMSMELPEPAAATEHDPMLELEADLCI